MLHKILTAVVIGFLLGGCIKFDFSDILSDIRFVPGISVHPLYEEKDLVFDDKLLGTWTDESGTKLIFEKAEDPNAYGLTIIIDPNTQQDKLIAYLVKIDDMLFLDISPRKPSRDNIHLQQMLNIPGHLFIKIEQIIPALKGKMVSFVDMIDHDPNILKHEVVGSNILVTASTEQLQEFLRQHRTNKTLFEESEEPGLIKLKDCSTHDSTGANLGEK